MAPGNVMLKASQFNVSSPSMARIQQGINFTAAGGSVYETVLASENNYDKPNRHLFRAAESLGLYAVEPFLRINFPDFQKKLQSRLQNGT